MEETVASLETEVVAFLSDVSGVNVGAAVVGEEDDVCTEVEDEVVVVLLLLLFLAESLTRCFEKHILAIVFERCKCIEASIWLQTFCLCS